MTRRGPTHWVAAGLVGLLFAAVLPDPAGDLVAAFAWGELSHVVADALTVSGVPFSPPSERRFHLFGGRLRTGGGSYLPFFSGRVGKVRSGNGDGEGVAGEPVPVFLTQSYSRPISADVVGHGSAAAWR